MNFGSHLREARERRGMSLRQIATSTRISLRTLEALENNEVGKLPGGIFSRAFVRSYANEVGLDPDETVKEFVHYFPVDHVTAGTAAAAEGDLILGEDEQRRRRAMGILLAVAIGVPLAVLILYLTFSARHPVNAAAAAIMPDATTMPESAPSVTRASTPASAASSPSTSSSTIAGATAPAKSTASTGTASVAPANVSTSTAAGASTATIAGAAATGPIASNEPLRLKIAPDGPCWVRVRADDGLHHEQLLQKGEVYTLNARNAFDLVVGDAGTCRFTVNDRRGRALGDRGEVVEARLTRANIQSWLAPGR